MSIRVRRKTDEKKRVRLKNRKKIREKVFGTAEKPRLAVFRSNKHLYVQLIDDLAKKTLASASTTEEDLRSKVKNTIDGAKIVGGLIAKRALAKKVNKVVFDRSGFIYHGRVKALADSAREGGLKF